MGLRSRRSGRVRAIAMMRLGRGGGQGQAGQGRAGHSIPRDGSGRGPASSPLRLLSSPSLGEEGWEGGGVFWGGPPAAARSPAPKLPSAPRPATATSLSSQPSLPPFLPLPSPPQPKPRFPGPPLTLRSQPRPRCPCSQSQAPAPASDGFPFPQMAVD